MRSIGSRTRFTAMAVAATALLGATGCATSTPPPAAAAPPSIAEASPTVPSGRSFHASLDGPLASQHASAGDQVTATIDEPLRAVDGTMVVPKGAKLHGHILEVAREGINRLVLRFDTIDVGGRSYAIAARVTRIESARVVASSSADATSDSVTVYPILPRTALAPEVGGGPPAEQLPLELDAGIGIKLVLSRPVVLSPLTQGSP